MKLNKTWTLTALMAASLFTGTLAASAQDATPTNNPPRATPPTTAPRMRGGIDMVANQLELTDEQKTKVQPVLEDMQKQLRDLRTDASLSPTEKRAKQKEIRAATTEKLKALNVLSDDQLEKWSEMGPRNRRPAMAAPPAPMGQTAPTTTAPSTNTPPSDATK